MFASDPPSTAADLSNCVDLHTHSTASDGSDSPSVLLSNAAAKGLQGIALCDHDTVSGNAEFLEAARSHDIIAIPGVEISTSLYSKELHIVGLFINHTDPVLNEALEKLRECRETRNRLIIEKLRGAGYRVCYDELLEFAKGESVGRPHVARLLISKGYFETTQQVFDKCLKRGSSMYTPRTLLSPEETISAIHHAGGLAVWAHPIHRESGERSFLRKYARRLTDMGLDGIEVFYSMFSEGQSALVKEIADEFKLLKSGGSDYHGINQPGLELGSGRGGLRVPYSLLAAMLQRKPSFSPSLDI